MIFLHWDIGRGIVEKQKALGWGESVVEMVAEELRLAFPSVLMGFSSRNMRDYEVFLSGRQLTKGDLATACRQIDQRGTRPGNLATSCGSNWMSG